MLNKSLKCFSKLYVGIRSGGNLAFATPYETNAQGLKRQETVNFWVRGYNITEAYKKHISIVDNVPRSGFKITDDVKRVYWGGGNVVFRVMDPLGWEVEIQSNNLMVLIESVGINKGGEIPGKCIWARDGAHNILLHESSEEFKNLMMNAESTSTIRKCDKVIGSTYRLKNGSRGQYLGECWVQALVSVNKRDKLYTNVWVDGKKFSAEKEENVLVQQKYEAVLFAEEENKIKFFRTANLIGRLDEAEMSKEKAIVLINNNSKKQYAVEDYRHQIISVTAEKIENPTFTLCDLSNDEIDKINNELNESFKHRNSLFYIMYKSRYVTLLDNGDCYFGGTYGNNCQQTVSVIISETAITKLIIDEYYSSRTFRNHDEQNHTASNFVQYKNIELAREAILEMIKNNKLKTLTIVEK